VIVDPVLVAAEAVARMKHRRIPVGDPRQLVEPAAGEVTQPVEMRRQLSVVVLGQIKRQQIAQATTDLVKIQAGAIPRNAVRAAGRRRFGRHILDRPDYLRAMHGFLLAFCRTLLRRVRFRHVNG
jgi:hypothetical protein